MEPRNARFGSIPVSTRTSNPLTPVSKGRNLLKISNITQSSVDNTEPPFIEEKQAVALEKAEQEQSGSGLGDSILAGAKAISSFVPGALGSTAGKVASTLGKVAVATEAAKLAGRLGSELAFGRVGTRISNRLSETFNKNPNWAPGFAGEQHLVLNTPHGLTRASFCGPKTALKQRIVRGDKGVNQIDSACMKHDLLYHFARTPEDIRRADNEMIREVAKVTDSGRIQKGIVTAGIRAKTLGEDIGIFGPETFTSLNLEGRGLVDQMSGVSRHMGQITGRTFSSPMQSIQSRFGGNGVVTGSMLSGSELVGGGIRKSRLLGNVKGRDPSQVGLDSGFVQGSGNNAFVHMFPNRISGTIQGRGRPMEVMDFSRRKANDPTISGVPGVPGSGFTVPVEAEDVEKILPGQVLKKNVLKSLKKTRRAMNRNNMPRRGQKGGILGLLAGLAASIVVPEIIKLFSKKGKGMRGKGALNDILKDVTPVVSKVRSTGSISGEGFFDDLAKGAELAALAVPRTFNQFGRLLSGKKLNPRAIIGNVTRKRGRKRVKGRGLSTKYKRGTTRVPRTISQRSQRGKGPGSQLIMKLAKKHGILPLNLSHNALAPLIRSAIGKSKGKQKGGQLPMLAGLAASLILPKIIKSIKK